MDSRNFREGPKIVLDERIPGVMGEVHICLIEESSLSSLEGAPLDIFPISSTRSSSH